MAKCWTVFHGFAYNSLLSRPFLTRNVSNRSSHRALHNGLGVVSSIQLLVWSTVRSNLGQTWSTLIKLDQSSPNSGKCILDHVLGVFWVWWTPVGSGTAWSNLGQTWSTSVKLGQSSPNFGKCIPNHVLRVSRYIGPQSGWKRLGQTLIKLGQLLVKLGQPWENLVGFLEMYPRPHFEVI